MQKAEGRMLRRGRIFEKTESDSRLRKMRKLNQKRRAQLDTSLLFTNY